MSAGQESTVRRYPGVLEPGEVNVLSFEVGGKLGRLDLSVGERVDNGAVLAQLDSAQFQSAVQQRSAAAEAVRVRLVQAEEDLTRSETLLERGAVTRVRRDEDRTRVQELQAELTQAEQSRVQAEEDLSDTVLTAPFDGIVSALEVDSFATVSAGQTVLSVYEATDFEVSFFVSFDVASRLVVGTPAKVRLADDPSIVLDAVVSELGERADTVSSFPVVVKLSETVALMKAGMAVEVAFEFEVPGASGFLIPISAAISEGEIPEDAGPNSVIPVPVFVFDPETSTVERRMVTFAGLRENNLVVIEGLEEGERVASKGVSFLREGMKVKLLEPED
ncbi:MAG: efflux RND transporter periplasmic adaptor subunit [Pseudomonadota bacterium]